MASSQAANINLFLPILTSPHVDTILRQIKPDYNRLATSELDNGFRIEFWDSTSVQGLLGDHTTWSGTDSDIAIAYYNHEDELCLWLIEHKLTEAEFTECGGYKSKNNRTKHLCNKNFATILRNKHYCYYHKVRKFKYWDITDRNRGFFINHIIFDDCPFKKGVNQLWRNQLLGLALENTKAYEHVYFTVVKHEGNTYLNKSIKKYAVLTNFNKKFSDMISRQVIDAARTLRDPALDRWSSWYYKLYNL
jgi:hypothetical protein